MNKRFLRIIQLTQESFEKDMVDFMEGHKMNKLSKKCRACAVEEIFTVIDKYLFRCLNEVDYTIGDLIYDINEFKEKLISKNISCEEDEENY